MKSSWSAGSMHVSWNFFFVWVYIVHPVSSLRMKSESFERPILCYCQFFFLILFWHLTSVDYTWHSQTPNKTVHSDKADKSLDELFQYCALVWCCLSFRGLNQTAALWPCGLNQVGVKRQRNMTEHMWCFPLEACLSIESTLLNWFWAFIVFRLWCTFILHEFMWVFVLFCFADDRHYKWKRWNSAFQTKVNSRLMWKLLKTVH